ncbi:hypothetical protein N499_0472 [Wolbachia pipientis wVitA]|nr:hypothetical protein N500_0585 [Wolbachia pipientis wUni]ONI57854.1 hypothetical protein N499_0472 [Wolbachia pipientis wVitA]
MILSSFLFIVKKILYEGFLENSLAPLKCSQHPENLNKSNCYFQKLFEKLPQNI